MRDELEKFFRSYNFLFFSCAISLYGKRQKLRGVEYKISFRPLSCAVCCGGVHLDCREEKWYILEAIRICHKCKCNTIMMARWRSPLAVTQEDVTIRFPAAYSLFLKKTFWSYIRRAHHFGGVQTQKCKYFVILWK